MASDWIYTVGDAAGQVVGDNLSRLSALAGDLSPSTIVANNQILARAAYTWQNIGARVTQNNLPASSVFAVLNGIDQAALEVVIGANSTGWFEDIVGSVAVADGDLLHYRMQAGNGGHADTITLTAISSQLQHAFLEQPIAITYRASANVPQATTSYFPIIGSMSTNGASTESDAEYILRQDVTFSNFRIEVSSNATDNASTVDFREDGVSSTNLTISVPANTTGSFEDTDSEAVSTGSTVNYRAVAGAGMSGDTLRMPFMHIVQAGAVSGRNLGAADPQIVPFGVNTTNYLVLEGPLSSSTTELDTQIEVPAPVDLTDMFVRITANSLTTAATTVALRVNGADSALDISIVAGGTGTFEDSDKVSVDVDDLINWELAVAAGGSGTISVTMIGLEQGQIDGMAWYRTGPIGIAHITPVRAY